MKILRKGVAVSTIVWIILAVMVIGLVGYLIYDTFWKGKCKIDSTNCLAARLECCCGRSTLAEAQDACVHCGPADIANCAGMPCSGPCE